MARRPVRRKTNAVKHRSKTGTVYPF